MRTTMTTWTLLRAVRAAALAAILAVGASACEHTASLEPLSPRLAPDADAESREMDALVTVVKRESLAQGSADPARERLVAALLVAVREPAQHGPATEPPAAAVTARVEHVLLRLLAAQGDSAAMVSALQELANRDGRTP